MMMMLRLECFTLIAAVFQWTTPLVSGQALNVTIIHINDHHSHFDEETFELLDDKVPPGLSVETKQLRVNMGESFS